VCLVDGTVFVTSRSLYMAGQFYVVQFILGYNLVHMVPNLNDVQEKFSRHANERA